MKIGKVKKIVTNLHDKTEYVIHMVTHIRNLKRALNHRLIFKKVHWVIKCSQKSLTKTIYLYDWNLRQKAKHTFEKDFFKLKNKAGFGKTMENARKKIFKIITTERRRNYLVSEPNYHTTKFFTENLLAIEIRKTQILMYNPVYLDSWILDLSKTVMYEFGMIM